MRDRFTESGIPSRSPLRVFLLTYFYPPDSAVGGLRPARVASALARAGHTVHVITAAAAGKPEPGTRVPDGQVLWPVRLQRTLREVALAVKGASHRSVVAPAAEPARKTSAPLAKDSQRPTPYSIPRWKRWIYSLMWLPDDRQGFIWPAYAAVRRLSPTPQDVLYTSGPPFSTHLAGLLVSLRFGCRWVLEYRDPWSDNVFKPWWVRSRWADALELRLQAACLKRANLLVAVSEGIRDRLIQLLPPSARDRVLVILNGVPETGAPAPMDGLPPRPFRILHAGTFYLRRDPRPFLQSLARVVAARGLRAGDLQVDLVGHCRSFEHVSLEEEVRRLGLAELVRFYDWLPQDRVEAMMRQAHLLLLMAQGQPDQIPNKLYDYLAARRPILAYADDEGETARMLRRFRNHIVLTSSDPEATESALHAALDRQDTRPLPSPDEAALLETWSANAQMAKLTRHLKQLVTEHPRG